MHTVSSALAVIVWPVFVIGLLSVILFAISRLPIASARAGDLGKRVVDLARKLQEQNAVAGAAAPAIPDVGKLNLRDYFTAEELEGTQDRKWLSFLPGWAIALGAGIFALLLSVIVAVYFLYVPMVSETYRRLYLAHCQSDAVTRVLSQQSGSRNFTAESRSYDACKPFEDKDPPKPLARKDVFFLLQSLGLLDSKEKSASDLYTTTGVGSTRNGLIAALLVRPDVYLPGMPTSELLVRLAGRLKANFDVPPAGASTEVNSSLACRVAGLSAIAAQQPYLEMPLGAHEGGVEQSQPRSLGRTVLGSAGVRPLIDVLSPPGSPDRKEVCYGDDELTQHHLGADYRARASGKIWPLLEKPNDRLNDAEIVSVALGWANWKASDFDNETAQQAAVIAFMRAIASEAGSAPEVRDARIGVNFFIGWERLAILIVTVFLGLCLLWQQAMNILDIRHLRKINDVMEAAAETNMPPALPLKILAAMLNRRVGRSAPREIMVAAVEVAEQQSSNKTVDYDRVRRVAEHELKIVDRSRFFFLAGLPLLPTIGFVGTVRSLIEALALADNIPRARDAISQVTAVSDVTSTLSLCFSTTFMALSALLVFAPLDLWQATRERQVIEESERLLDPGL
jgi:hypothetical protein